MLLFDRLCSSVSCHWTSENVDHILSVGDSMYLSSLQEGVTPDTATLSINNLPKSVCWIAESSEAILDLSTSRTRNQVRPTLAKTKIKDRPTLANKTKIYQPSLAQTSNEQSEALETKTEGQSWSTAYGKEFQGHVRSSEIDTDGPYYDLHVALMTCFATEKYSSIILQGYVMAIIRDLNFGCYVFD